MSGELSYLTVGGLTLDDIVAADGSVHRVTAGGNALYAALGASIWSDCVGMLSFVGDDYPAETLDRIRGCGIDVRHVRRLNGPSIHLWILYEPEGLRQISYQHRSSSLVELEAVVAEQSDALGERLAQSAAVHVAALPVALQRAVLEPLRSLGRPITLDSIEARGSVGGDLADYRREGVFDGVVGFLPSLEEWRVLAPGEEDATAVARSFGGDLQVVVITRGAEGCDVVDLRNGTRVRLPALGVAAVDPTGAGDAFCGGFMVALAETGDPTEAALRATVSASFAVEEVGSLHLCDVTRVDAGARLETLRSLVTTGEMRS